MKPDVNGTKSCPHCGGPLPAGALEGLCPACLLAQGAETEPDAEAAAAGKGLHFSPPSLEEVTRLFPQLEILGLLGAGGMGAVYKARQPTLDRMVALKILPSAGTGATNFADRFNREARALARLSHPNIVAVHEFGQTEGLPYFIMEFVDGANLRQLEQTGRLSPREALQIIPQICDALQYAHDQGVVHRDIKPENVLVDRKSRVKIADFGLAKILGVERESLRLTAEGQVMGTPHYMAPEQVEKPLTVDHRADIYSLGVVFYEMLTGELPLGKFPPPSRKVQVDVRLDDVVLHALEKDPERRYQKASEVKSRVETIAGSPVEETSKSSPEPAQSRAVGWAGFPLVIDHNGARTVNWKSVAHASAILFAVLTLVFGAVSLITGRSIFGWLGVVAWPGVTVRIALTALGVGGAVWYCLRRSLPPENLPRAPQGTVILPAERYSRKAIIGACWMPLFLIVASLSLFVTRVETHVGNATPPAPSMAWWQIALSVTLLPLGLTAPIGTTILGWLAVADIRRWRGRIAGLGLAVFDGLVFPLMALDILLFRGLVLAFYWGTAHLLPPTFVNPPALVVWLGAGVICGLVDFMIIRRVWRAVRWQTPATQPAGKWWWSTRAGGIALAILCGLMIMLVAGRREQPGIFKYAADQVARTDPATGALVAQLPNGGRMELLALAEIGAGPEAWWCPDGTPTSPTTYEFRQSGQMDTPMTVPKDLIFRFVNLPEGVIIPQIECNPGTGYSSGDTVRRDGQVIPDAWPLRMAWPERVEQVDIRLGVSLEPWRTIARSRPDNTSSLQERHSGDPNWTVRFHQAGESRRQALLTVVLDVGEAKWETRVVAADLQGVEHNPAHASGTPAERLVTWTYAFDLPLAEVKEFRVQVRRSYWVEFPKVALRSPNKRERAQDSRRPATISVRDRTELPKPSESSPEIPATAERLAQEPELRFVAWQNESNEPPSVPAYHSDGEPVTDRAEKEILRELTPTRCDARGMNDENTNPPFLHFWFAHPLFDHQSLVSLKLLNEAGQPLPLGAKGMMANRSETAGELSADRGWLMATLSPSDDAPPSRVNIRLDYALGPLERTRTVAADFRGGMALPGNSQLSAIGNDSDGKSFVALAINSELLGPRQFGVIAVTQDDRELAQSGGGRSGTSEGPTLVERFVFDIPLRLVKHFKIGTRPVRTVIWKDVTLPPATP